MKGLNVPKPNTEDLPEGWTVTKIKHISELIGGGTPSRKNLEYFDGNIIWLTPTEIPKHSIMEISNSREKITKLGLQKSSAKIIPTNSVLLTSRASIGYVAVAGRQVTTNQGFASFVCNSLVFNYYLAYWLWGNRNILKENATGTTFKEIPKSKLKELRIPLPPLNEQHRIVSKLESIFAQIDAAKERLLELQGKISSGHASLASLKGSVLKQAFEGRLVPQDPNDEPAEVLLRKICKNSEINYEKDNLPKGWVRTKLKEIIDNPKQNIVDGPFGSNLKASEYVDEGVPLIRLQNVERNYFVDKNRKYITKEKASYLQRHNFVQNDIVITKLGFPVGKACIIPSYLEYGIIVADIIRIRNNDKIVLTEFLTHMINSNILIKQFTMHTKGTTRPRVNLTKFRNFQLLLPPINEQKRIVSKIESIFARIDAIEKYVESTLDLLDNLKNSTLKTAFAGRLVPQDPSDEPAEVLLQRIKNQKLSEPRSVRRNKNVK